MLQRLDLAEAQKRLTTKGCEVVHFVAQSGFSIPEILL